MDADGVDVARIYWHQNPDGHYAAIARLIAAAPLLLDTLTRIQWDGRWRNVSDEGFCPWCGNHEMQGHESDCIIGVALATAQG